MDVAALVISVVALAVSVWAVWYTRRQTVAAEEANEIASAVGWSVTVEPFADDVDLTVGPCVYLVRHSGAHTVNAVVAVLHPDPNGIAGGIGRAASLERDTPLRIELRVGGLKLMTAPADQLRASIRWTDPRGHEHTTTVPIPRPIQFA